MSKLLRGGDGRCQVLQHLPTSQTTVPQVIFPSNYRLIHFIKRFLMLSDDAAVLVRIILI